MASIKNMMMANTLLSNPSVETKKGLFGLSTKFYYIPSGSIIKGYEFDYDTENGPRIKDLLETKQENLEEAIAKISDIKSSQIGGYRLQVAVSDDHQFAALQMFTFSDFQYRPMTDVKIYVGDRAKLISKIL